MPPAHLVCVECGRRSDPDARGWRAYLVEDDYGERDQVILYCPICATREFGGAPHRRQNQRES